MWTGEGGKERRWAGYLMLSLAGPPGVAVVLLQISSVLASAVCLPAPCLWAWHCAPAWPARPRWRSLWSPRPEETAIFPQQCLCLSTLFPHCLHFSQSHKHDFGCWLLQLSRRWSDARSHNRCLIGLAASLCNWCAFIPPGHCCRRVPMRSFLNFSHPSCENVGCMLGSHVICILYLFFLLLIKENWV